MAALPAAVLTGWLLLGPAGVGGGRHHGSHRRRRDGRCRQVAAGVGEESVRSRRHRQDRRQVILGQGEADLLGQATQEEAPEDLGVHFTGRAELPHLGQEHGGALAAQGRRLQEQIQTLELVHGVGLDEPLLDAVESVRRRRADLQDVGDLDQLVLAEDGDDIGELVAAIGHPPEMEGRVRGSEPGRRPGRPEGRQMDPLRGAVRRLDDGGHTRRRRWRPVGGAGRIFRLHVVPGQDAAGAGAGAGAGHRSSCRLLNRGGHQ